MEFGLTVRKVKDRLSVKIGSRPELFPGVCLLLLWDDSGCDSVAFREESGKAPDCVVPFGKSVPPELKLEDTVSLPERESDPFPVVVRSSALCSVTPVISGEALTELGCAVVVITELFA